MRHLLILLKILESRESLKNWSGIIFYKFLTLKRGGLDANTPFTSIYNAHMIVVMQLS